MKGVEMKKFLLGLVASCLVLFVADTAQADHGHRSSHHHHGGHSRHYSSGHHHHHHGYGGSTFQGGYPHIQRSYGGIYSQGFYGYPAIRPDCYNYNYGRGHLGIGGSRFGLHFSF